MQVNKAYYDEKEVKFHEYSEQRKKSVYENSGICAGCKCQNIQYILQLYYKQIKVLDNWKCFRETELFEFEPILDLEKQFFYRTKMEFLFSNSLGVAFQQTVLSMLDANN